MLERNIRLLNTEKKQFTPDQRARIFSALKYIGIPHGTKALHIHLSEYTDDASVAITATPAGRKKPPIVEKLEIHWP